MNALDRRADRLRREYCAKLGVTFFPEWDDIRNEKTKELWRSRAARIKRHRSFHNPEVNARAVATRVAGQRAAARKKLAKRVRKRFPWVTV